MNDPKPAAPEPTLLTAPVAERPLLPLPNDTLSTVCPACGADTFKLVCKVRCGFMWDCSEL